MKSPQPQNSKAVWLYQLPHLKAMSVGFNFPSLVNHNQQARQTRLQRSLCIIFMTYFLIYTSTWTRFLLIHHLSNFRKEGLNTTVDLTSGTIRAKRQLQVLLHTEAAKTDLQPIFHFLCECKATASLYTKIKPCHTPHRSWSVRQHWEHAGIFLAWCSLEMGLKQVFKCLPAVVM